MLLFLGGNKMNFSNEYYNCEATPGIYNGITVVCITMRIKRQMTESELKESITRFEYDVFDIFLSNLLGKKDLKNSLSPIYITEKMTSKFLNLKCIKRLPTEPYVLTYCIPVHFFYKENYLERDIIWSDYLNLGYASEISMHIIDMLKHIRPHIPYNDMWNA